MGGLKATKLRLQAELLKKLEPVPEYLVDERWKLFKKELPFRHGYEEVLEGKLSAELLNSRLKAKPHIESRLKTLKNDFQTVHEMLTGTNTSGFGWDDVRKFVTAEDASHIKAASFKNKSFPLYEDLSIVYAKDHANGKNAESPINVAENLDMEGKGNDDIEKNGKDAESPINVAENLDMEGKGNDDIEKNAKDEYTNLGEDLQTLQTGKGEGLSSRKRKKRDKGKENIMEAMKEVASLLGSQLKDVLDKLSKADIGTIASEN
ncbi:uncharacterized protein At2g29880-like [Ziziphus jujuba]|uniref:Uncharacterized protein At2g29880-like n=1 Tax=Ziziphus jujuba TaxID=326968 RepID=A0ABM3ISY4_ZIZJJ|nr:uncharacterized protein At2g29880-like [Ziziphus jujuba]